MKQKLAFILTIIFLSSLGIFAQDRGKPAPKPLFRDPVYDGAADPVVIWNPKMKRWWMFYTNRRANAPGLSGVAWVHGTRIGIAESTDGANWKYVGTADIKLPDNFGGRDVTHWAPDVVRGDDGKWHMFLTVVPGIFENWQHPRDIVQLTSKDLRTWDYFQTLKLSADRVIDAGLMKMPDGLWRMWYNNEREKKSIYYAESRDLKTWTDKGKAVNDKPGEGPKVFHWKEKYWMIVDQWKGLGVYRSDDALNWEPKNDNLLATPGKGTDDQVIGQHPDVIVNGGRAYLIYFTHPGRTPDNAKKDTSEQRRSSMQVVELNLKDGWLTADRDETTYIKLIAPKK
ncbi:MAG: family 43 glycosylhydrolase [Pyrinomonadaceae bacterium]